MEKSKKLKEAKIQEIKGKMEKAECMVLTKYQGLTVEEDTKLRKELRDAGVEYKVYKNTLALRAAKQVGLDQLEDYFVGPVSIAFGYEDPTVPARILNNFSKDHKALELKGGVVKGEMFDESKIKEFASIPPRKVLIAKLLGSFKAPVSNFVYVLNAIQEKQKSEEA